MCSKEERVKDKETHRRITRRDFLGGAVALGAAGASSLIAGCAPSAPESKPASSQPGAAPTTQAGSAPAVNKGVVELRMIGNAGDGLKYEKAIELFTKKTNGQIKVVLDVVPFDSLFEKEMVQFISKTPTYDVLNITSGQYGGIWQYLSPLDKFIAADKVDFVGLFGPKGSNPVTFDSGIVALPRGFAAPVFFYRKDAFDAASISVPKTRDEYRALAKKLTKKGADGKTEVYGTSFYGKVTQWTLESFANLFFRGGGRFLTNDLKAVHPVLRDAYTADTIDFMKAIVDDGVTPDPVGWASEDNLAGFQQEKLMTSFHTCNNSGNLEDPKASKVVGKMGYAAAMMEKLGPEPQTIFGNTWNVSIDKNSKNQEAAWEFCRFFTTDLEGQKQLALSVANAPVILKLLDDPEVVKVFTAAPAVKEVLAGPGWIDFFPVPQYAELVKIVHEEMQAVYLGRQKGAQAAQKLAQRFEDTMKRG